MSVIESIIVFVVSLIIFCSLFYWRVIFKKNKQAKDDIWKNGYWLNKIIKQRGLDKKYKFILQANKETTINTCFLIESLDLFNKLNLVEFDSSKSTIHKKVFDEIDQSCKILYKLGPLN